MVGSSRRGGGGETPGSRLSSLLAWHKAAEESGPMRVLRSRADLLSPVARVDARLVGDGAPPCHRTQRHQESQALCDALDLLLQCGSLKRRRTGGGGGERAEAAGGAACGAAAPKVIVALRISPVFPLRSPLHRANLRKAMEERWCPQSSVPGRESAERSGGPVGTGASRRARG